MKFIVFLLVIFFNANQIIAQDKKRKKKQDIENSLELDKITFEEAAIKILELQNFEENIFNPLINQIFKFSSADLILEKCQPPFLIIFTLINFFSENKVSIL